MSSRRTHSAPVQKLPVSAPIPVSSTAPDPPGYSFHSPTPVDDLTAVFPFPAPPSSSSAALDYASFLQQPHLWHALPVAVSAPSTAPRPATLLSPAAAHGPHHIPDPRALPSGANRHKRRRPQPSPLEDGRRLGRQFHTSAHPFRSDPSAARPRTSVPASLPASSVAAVAQMLFPSTSSPTEVDEDEDEEEEKYVREAAAIADRAKLTHRTTLKEAQRMREERAERCGAPLSAKDKERERSRRESAVTRKRSEVYIGALECAARRVPPLEREVRALRALLRGSRREGMQGMQGVSPVSVEDRAGTPQGMEHIEL